MTADQWAIAIGLFALLVSIVAAGAAMNSASASNRSAIAAEKQLALVERKIGMVTDPGKMTEVLPIWYVDRMASDYWAFGLLLSSGSILAIEQIEAVSDDGKWLEVSLLPQDGRPDEIYGHRVIYRVVNDRRNASVRVEQIETAFEIQTI